MPISILVYKQRFQNPNYKSTASKNYAHIRYIATRPRVSKNEGMNHGLFGKLTPGPMTEFEDWQEVARLVYQNSKKHVTMYRSIVSFDEDTAAEIRLTGQKAWQRYIENHILTIAQKNGIRREDLQWAGAFHREKNHPHIHVVFWDISSKVKNPFTPPSIPNAIRRQMIKDTFADKIRAFGEQKTNAVTGLRAVSDELAADFERHMRRLGKSRYRKMRREHAAELTDSFDFTDKVLNETADRVFKIKSALPPTGRIAYGLLPPDIKTQVDGLTAYLLSSVPALHRLKGDYVDSKMKMALFYGGSDDYLGTRRKRFEGEADKIIANRILGMVRTLNRLDYEGRSVDRIHSRRQYYAEQMLIEMLDMLSAISNRNNHRDDNFANTWGGNLSKEVRKELYLKNRDKGYEH